MDMDVDSANMFLFKKLRRGRVGGSNGFTVPYTGFGVDIGQVRVDPFKNFMAGSMRRESVKGI